MVVAVLAVPAERGEVVQPEQRADASFMRGDVQAPLPVPAAARAGAAGRGRPGRRRSGTRSGGTARRTARRSRPGRPPAASTRTSRRQHARASARTGSATRRPGGSGDVDVRDLAAGVHAGVGAAGHGQPRPARPAAATSAERVLERLLDRPQPRLARPPGEVRAVVREVQPQAYDSDEPAVPCWGGGLVVACVGSPASAGVVGLALGGLVGLGRRQRRPSSASAVSASASSASASSASSAAPSAGASSAASSTCSDVGVRRSASTASADVLRRGGLLGGGRPRWPARPRPCPQPPRSASPPPSWPAPSWPCAWSRPRPRRRPSCCDGQRLDQLDHGHRARCRPCADRSW